MVGADMVELALVAGIAVTGGALFAFTVPLRVLAFVWAALLPIYVIGPVPPLVLDVARYALAVAIGVRAIAAHPRRPSARPLWRWTTALVLLGGWLVLVGYTRPDPFDASVGTTIVVAALVAAFALFRLPDPLPVLAGFSAGATLSGIVILASAAGVGLADSLAPGLSSGGSRAQGLSTGSTRVASDLAIAVIVFGLLALHRRRHRILSVAAALVCGAALLLSGGRGGLAMVTFAAVWLLVRRRLTGRRLALALIASAAVFWWLANRGFTLNTITRLFEPSRTSDFTTGRGDLNAAALDSILHGGFLSEGSAYFLFKHGATAHFAPLTFGVAGGVVAFVVSAGLVIALGRAMFSRADSTGLYIGLAAALFAYTLIEPRGPFAGLTSVVILFACVMGLSSRQDPDGAPPGSGRRVRRAEQSPHLGVRRFSSAGRR